MKNCDSMATRGRVPRVIGHFMSFVPARSTSSWRHTRTRARARDRIVDETSERTIGARDVHRGRVERGEGVELARELER